MSRLFVLLSFATLCLSASCVDVNAPARVSQCERDNSCIDGTGGATGGKGGATAGSGGSASRSADAGVSDVPAGGRGGSGGGGGTGGSGGQVSGGSTGGSSTESGSTGGTGGEATGGTTGGSSGTADAGTEPTPDAPIDKPVDVPFDTYVKPDLLPDTASTGPEVSPPDLGPDLSPDSSPDRLPDTAFDAPTCIQSFKSNSYTVSVPTDAGANACSECKENGNSQEAQCKTMIDCLQSTWVCKPSGGCWMDCLHTANGDSVLEDCVKTLVTKACPGL